METINYLKFRDTLKSGDIILCHGNTLISNIINSVDNSYWHHCEVIYKVGNRILSVGAHPGDSRIDFLSQRIIKKGWTEIMIISPKQPTKVIDRALKNTMDHCEEFSSYDIPLLFRIYLYETFNWDIKSLGSSDKDICSELGLYYLRQLGDSDFNDIKRPFFTPQDILRYMDENNYKING